MRYTWVLIAAFACGCAKQPTAATLPIEMGNSFDGERPKQLDGSVQKDAPAPTPAMVRLDVWRLSLPYGTVSRNEEFWKRINEQCVDVATYDLLFKNGIRVGQAPTREWDYFKTLMEQHPAQSQKTAFTGVEMQAIEMEMRKGIDSETLFVYNNENEPVGRTYDHCDNLFMFSFQPAPRRPGQVRVALCPVVRALRKRLEFTLLNDEKEIRFVNPERLYDLNLRCDVPMTDFLIVAPSSDVWKSTSVGRAFLVRDGQVERFEEILLIVPQPIKMDEVAKVASGKPQ